MNDGPNTDVKLIDSTAWLTLVRNSLKVNVESTMNPGVVSALLRLEQQTLRVGFYYFSLKFKFNKCLLIKEQEEPKPMKISDVSILETCVFRGIEMDPGLDREDSFVLFFQQHKFNKNIPVKVLLLGCDIASIFEY